MMSYGWAILIIVIVAAALWSFGVFNPSSSTSTTVTGFSGLGSVSAACFPGGDLVLELGNSLGTSVKITKLNTSTQTGSSLSLNFSTMIVSDSTVNFVIPGACSSFSGSRYSNSVSVTYTEPGQPFPGPYFSTGTVSGVSAVQGQAGNFNGGTSTFYAPAGMWLGNSNVNITLLAWAYSPSSGGSVAGVSSALFSSGCGSSWNIEFLDINGSAYAGGQIYNGSASAFIKTKAAFSQWNQEVITYISTTHIESFYLNGQFIASKNINGYLPSSAFDYITTCQSTMYGVSGHFTGKIADIQLYNKTLTSAQIATMDAEGFGSAPAQGAGLIGWWPLDGNPNDYSGNNNNGVTTNVQWVSH